MASSTAAHTADAAGGEAIYSSDGLKQLPVPPPPILKRPINEDRDNNTDTLDYESPSSIQAFEVFAGKVWGNNMNSAGSSRAAVGYQVPIVGQRGQESRLEKLARIQAELQQLEEESKSIMQIDDSNNDDIVNTQGNNDQANDGEKEIMKVVKDLSEKLRILQNNNIDVKKRHQFLTSKMNSIVNQKDDDNNNNASRPNDATKNIKSLQQQERLLRIEKCLGTQIHTSIPTESILERLKQAEGKLNSIDDETLNNAASRAKVIRADLEAAAKARSKINNTNVEDASKIAKLHQQLVDLDGFLSPSSSSSNILSTIVVRLSTCATLHSQSMEFGKDLKALEHMVKDVEVMLHSVEDSVNCTEKSMKDNMDLIRKNMETLDQQL